MQQQVVLQVEQAAEPVLEMLFQCLFVRQKLVQRPVQPLLVDLVARNAQQLGHCRASVIVLGNVQFARRIAQAADRPYQRPVSVSLAVLLSVTRPDEHARILGRNQPQSSRKVFTTTRFNLYQAKNGPHGVNPGKLHPPRDPVLPETFFGKTDLSTGLANLG